jgi:hypothetical protein
MTVIAVAVRVTVIAIFLVAVRMAVITIPMTVAVISVAITVRVAVVTIAVAVAVIAITVRVMVFLGVRERRIKQERRGADLRGHSLSIQAQHHTDVRGVDKDQGSFGSTGKRGMNKPNARIS